MSRTTKLTTALALALAGMGLLVAAALLTPRLVSTPQVTGRILDAVSRATGFEVTLEEPLEVFLLPRPGVAVRGLGLARPGASGEPGLALARGRATLRLLPLLLGDVRLEEVRLQGLELRLPARQGGLPLPGRDWTGNLAGVLDREIALEVGWGLEISLTGADRVFLRNASVTADLGGRGAGRIGDLDLVYGMRGPGVFHVTWDFAWAAGRRWGYLDGAAKGKAAARGRFTYMDEGEEGKGGPALEDVQGQVRVTAGRQAGDGLPVTLDFQGDFKPFQGSLDLASYGLELPGLELGGSLWLRDMWAGPQAGGSVTAGLGDPAVFFSQLLGIPPPLGFTRSRSDPELQARIRLDNESLRLEDMVLTYGESRITGTVGITGLADPAFDLDLSADYLERADFIADFAAWEPPAWERSAAQGPSSAEAGPRPMLGRVLGVLAGLRLDLDLSAATGKLYGVSARDMRFDLVVDRGRLLSRRISATLDNGLFRGQVRGHTDGTSFELTAGHELSGREGQDQDSPARVLSQHLKVQGRAESYHGSWGTSRFSPARLARVLGLEIPGWLRAEDLEAVQASFSFQGGPGRVTARDLGLVMGRTRVLGEFTLSTTPWVLDLDLRAPTLDLAAYTRRLPPGDEQNGSWRGVRLPGMDLPLKIDLSLESDAVLTAAHRLSPLVLEASARGGSVDLDTLEMGWLEGEVRASGRAGFGDGTWDAACSLRASGLDITGLDPGTASWSLARGRLSGRAELQGRGRNLGALADALSASIAADLAQPVLVPRDRGRRAAAAGVGFTLDLAGARPANGQKGVVTRDLDLEAWWLASRGGPRLDLDVRGRAEHDTAYAVLRLDGARTGLRVGRDRGESGSLTTALAVRGLARLNTAEGSLRLEQGELDLGRASGEVSLKARGLAGPRWSLDAGARIGEFDPRRVLADMGVSLPGLRDQAALSRAAFAATVQAGEDVVEVKVSEFRLDSTEGSARAEIRSLSPLEATVDIRGTNLDLDRYRPAPGSGDDGAPGDLPTSLLSDLGFRGRAEFGMLKGWGIRLGDMRGEVRAVGGDISADLDAGDFHGGTAHAELRGRATLTSLELALDAEAGNVSMGPLFQDLLGKEYFRGKGLIELDLRATGTDVAEFVHSLEGRTLWHMPDGGQMKLFHDVVRKAPSPAGGTAQETLGRGREGDQGRPRDSTPITKAKATGNISGGVLRNSDLRVDSLVLKLRGDGVVNLADGQVDYSMVLELLGIARIPMRIQGPVLNPGVEVQPIRSLGQTAGNIISDAIRLPFRSLDTLGEILQLDRLKP